MRTMILMTICAFVVWSIQAEETAPTKKPPAFESKQPGKFETATFGSG